MNETRKWIFHRISAIIVAPLYIWLFFSLISLSTKNYLEAINFFTNPLVKILTIMLFFVAFFHARISLNEIFEDYIHNKKIKDVANILNLIFSIVIPLLIETGYQDFMDRILIIDCSLETQLARLMARDRETLENAKKIIANQIERNERLKFTDDIIKNEKETTIGNLKKKVLQLHQSYLELSSNRLI